MTILKACLISDTSPARPVIDYLLAMSPDSTPERAAKSVDRIVIMPGHVTTSGVGEQELVALREEALSRRSWNANRPNGAIYALSDDVSSIRTEVKGTTPNRTFVVEYRNDRFISGTQRLDFNIVLHEDGRVMTQYRNLADDGRERGNSSTIGIEDHTGAVALEFSMNEAVLPVEPAITSIVYRPPGMP